MTVLHVVLPDGRRATVTPGTDSTVVATGDTDVSSYDLAGRPYALIRGDVTVRRALDGRLLQKAPAGEGAPRLIRMVSAEQGQGWIEAARADVAAALAALLSEPAEPATEAAIERLRRIVDANHPAALSLDVERFKSVYDTVGILPPDQYLALVLQATEGCSWNACTFCELFRGRPFRVKSMREFEEHIEAVRQFFGDSIALRRSLFLGAANALCVASARMLPLMEAAVRAFPQAAAGGVHAFVDAWAGRLHSAEYAGYAALGLRRVYVGLETGDARLLSWLRKPGTPEDALRLVEALHESGIAVGVIVLLGAGGEAFFNAHARRTADLVARMDLGPEDILFFSELQTDPTREYARRAEAEGVAPLAQRRIEQQRRAIELGLAYGGRRLPRRATYDVREFVY